MIIWKIYGLVFIISILVVLPRRIKYMIRMRAPRNYKDTLFSDNEKVISGFQLDRSEWYLDYLLEITRWVLGGFLLWSLFFHQKAEITINDNNFIFHLTLTLNTLSMCMAGGFIGDGIVKPFWKKFATHRYYAISQKGVIYSESIFPWQIYNSYSVDDIHHYIHLWSAKDPKVIIFSFTPDSQEKARTLTDILKNYLPMNTHTGLNADMGSKFNFLQPGSISITVLALGMIAALIPTGLTPFFISALIILHYYGSYSIYKGMFSFGKLEKAEIQ